MSGFAPITCTNKSRLALMGLRFIEGEEGQGGYTPPATQDELNRIVQERVARATKPYEALKDLDVTDVAARYGRVKDVDLDALLNAQSELATVRSSQGQTEQQLTGQLTAAETRATAAETKSTADAATISDLTRKVMRYEAAAKAGIPLEHAARLIGSTPEELEQDAIALRPKLRVPGAGYDPSQGQGGGGGAKPGANGNAEADRRFGPQK